MTVRGKWQGMITIAQFNWPFYALALAALIASLAGLVLPVPFKLVFVIAALAATYFLVGSLGVSHFIYDRSDLYRWGWLQRALRGVTMRYAIVCHCGFDEASAELRDRFGGVHWQVLDHFDSTRITEASVRRARAMFPPTPGTLSSPHDAWPVAPESTDVVFGLLAIHELRTEAERCAWFAECRRCLRQGGRVVLVEHIRDAANFAAFGPGFFHFHSRKSWRQCWERAGFRSIDQFCVTPFVQIFVLARHD